MARSERYVDMHASNSERLLITAHDGKNNGQRVFAWHKSSDSIVKTRHKDMSETYFE